MSSLPFYVVPDHFLAKIRYFLDSPLVAWQLALTKKLADKLS